MTLTSLVTVVQLMLAPDPAQQAVIERFLVDHGAPASRATSLATRILRQSRLWKADPALVTAIVTVENHTLVSDTVSHAGAVGVMQVMPFWRRSSFRQRCGEDLTQDRVNLCYGINIIQTFLRERGSEERALLAYNGCRTLERCGHYPGRVLARRDRLASALQSGRR